jgi:NmrA-like family
VEVVSADLDNLSSLVAAFKGAQAIFSVTDTWGYMFDPSNDSKVKPSQTKIQLAYETELQRSKNVFDAAAKTEGLDRLVFSMLAGPKKWMGERVSGYELEQGLRLMNLIDH